MPPTVAPGLLRRIKTNRDGFVLQVQGADFEAAEGALRRVRAEILAVDAGPRAAHALSREDQVGLAYVSEVIPSPSGPFIYVDAAGLPDDLLEQIPRLVTRRLEDAGLSTAAVVSPPLGGDLDHLAETPREAALHLLPAPVPGLRGRAEMPEQWLEEAVNWLRPVSQNDDRLLVSIRSVQVELDLDSVSRLLGSLRVAREACVAVAGDLDVQVGGANVTHKVHPCLVLAAGGPAATDDDLLQAVERLKNIGRRLAPEVAYAFVGIQPTMFALASGRPPPDWASGLAAPDLVWRASDEVVLDAFHWQILSTGHLLRLEHVPDHAEPLDAGRVEVTLGDADDWLPGESHEEIRAQGRRTFAGCLLQHNEALLLLQERRRRRK